MQNVVMPSDVMQSDVMQSDVMQSIAMQSVMMKSVVMKSVVMKSVTKLKMHCHCCGNVLVVKAFLLSWILLVWDTSRVT